MNKKKATLLLSGLEIFLLMIVVALYVSEAINTAAFIGIIIALPIITSSILVVITRKLNS